MIGIIFVRVCVCRRETSGVIQTAAQIQLMLTGKCWKDDIYNLNKHTHTKKGRERVYVSRLVPARRHSSSLQLSGNIIITQKPQHPSLSILTFQHIYQHMPRMNTHTFSSQPSSFISPVPFHLSRRFLIRTLTNGCIPLVDSQLR